MIENYKMLKNYFKITIMLLSLVLTTTAHAVVVTSLYSTQTPITARTTTQLNQALSKTLKAVLIKVSGNPNIDKIATITEALNNPNQYVRNFNYQQNSTDTNKPLSLQVNFIPQAINNLLQQANQPIWAQNRPLTLVWLVTQNTSGTQLYNSSSDNPATTLTTNLATNRGLPIIFPMLDITDMQQIQASDVWAPFINVIKHASSRYSPDEILIIRIDTTQQTHIVSHWTLLSQDQQFTWDTEGNHLQEAIQAGIDQVISNLAKQFAVITNNNQSQAIKILITNLHDINDYAKITNYLRKLTGVINVEVQDITALQATFNLILNTDIAALQRTIQLDSILSSDNNPNKNVANTPSSTDEQQTQESILQYKFNRN